MKRFELIMASSFVRVTWIFKVPFTFLSLFLQLQVLSVCTSLPPSLSTHYSKIASLYTQYANISSYCS